MLEFHLHLHLQVKAGMGMNVHFAIVRSQNLYGILLGDQWEGHSKSHLLAKMADLSYFVNVQFQILLSVNVGTPLPGSLIGGFGASTHPRCLLASSQRKDL